MQYRVYMFIAGLLILSSLNYGCEKERGSMATVEKKKMENVSDEAWKDLAQKRIFFGHQSVGFNIIEGLKTIINEKPLLKLNLRETKNPSDFESILFAHARVGENMNPESKCYEFSDLISRALGDVVDIGFFKFCFVDFSRTANAAEVFKVYKNTMGTLSEKYPKIKFIHLTVPLTVQQKGPRAWVKTLLGKPLAGYEDNMKRNEFNDLLRKEYSGKQPIFDLAMFESTYPDGTRACFLRNGKTYYSLVPEYTHDGGHLNDKGRRIVAEQLLIFLAELASTRQ